MAYLREDASLSNLEHFSRNEGKSVETFSAATYASVTCSATSFPASEAAEICSKGFIIKAWFRQMKNFNFSIYSTP